MNIQEIVKLPRWQKLRQSLVGTWKHTPKENVKKLRKFMGPKPWKNERHLRIMSNYLTGSAFRIGIISHPTITKLYEEVKRSKSIL
jgi:hypothetical protein